MQNLLPHLIKITKRSEDMIHEALSQSFENILPILGHFFNDTETRNLMKVFLINISNPSTTIRRSAASCLINLSQYSRKPVFLSLWLLDTIMQLVVPVSNDTPSALILGVLQILRLLIPHFPSLLSPQDNSLNLQSGLAKESNKPSVVEISLSSDQVLQVWVHFPFIEYYTCF